MLSGSGAGGGQLRVVVRDGAHSLQTAVRNLTSDQTNALLRRLNLDNIMVQKRYKRKTYHIIAKHTVALCHKMSFKAAYKKIR